MKPPGQLRRSAPLGRSAIRQLGAGELPPAGEPRRYPNAAGYVRLRWKVGPRQYVETYERRDNGRLVRTREPEARRIDWDAARRLYESGLSLLAVAHQLGCSSGQLSRGLRRRSVPMRRPLDYHSVDVDLVVSLYVEHDLGGSDVARLAGTTVATVLRVLRERGAVVRSPGRPPGRTGGPTYDTEYRAARPAIIRRSGGRCEARVAGICTGRGNHVHHRKLRSQGGRNDGATLLHVCRACHLWAHGAAPESYRAGVLVHAWEDPAAVPLLAGYVPSGGASR